MFTRPPLYCNHAPYRRVFRTVTIVFCNFSKLVQVNGLRATNQHLDLLWAKHLEAEENRK